MSEIRRITVVGAGQMGAGIAQTAAVGGFDVTLRDVAPRQLEQAVSGIEASLAKLTEKGRLDEATRDAALGRIQTAAEPADADLLIEAATENVELKLRDPRVQHQLDPDHPAGGGHEAAAAGRRHAFHEPGAADAAGGGDPRP